MNTNVMLYRQLLHWSALFLMLYLLFVGSGKSIAQFEQVIGELEKTKDDAKLKWVQEKKLRCPQAMNELVAKCLMSKEKRCSLADNSDAIIPTLEKMRLQFLL